MYYYSSSVVSIPPRPPFQFSSTCAPLLHGHFGQILQRKNCHLSTTDLILAHHHTPNKSGRVVMLRLAAPYRSARSHSHTLRLFMAASGSTFPVIAERNRHTHAHHTQQVQHICRQINCTCASNGTLDMTWADSMAWICSVNVDNAWPFAKIMLRLGPVMHPQGIRL